MFKTSGRVSFLIILFQFLQYYAFVVLSGDAFLPALLLQLLHQRRRLHTNPHSTQRTFGNYWAFTVFRGPDFIANLSDGLKIIDPGCITCDNKIGKLLFGMLTFRAISRTVNLTSTSMISFILETISLRDAYLISVHFLCNFVILVI